MKTNNKLLISFVLAILMPAFAYCAEIIEDDPVVVTPAPKKTTVTAAVAATVKPTPAVTATVKPAPTQEPTKPPVSQETVAELKTKINDLNTALTALRDEIKTLQEKNIETANVAKDLEFYKKGLEDLQNVNSEDVKKVAELEKSFNGIQDVLKNKMDKMSSWDDILDVLKKEISNNELEIARLKKEINSLKKQYGAGEENVFDAIAQWPYLGITAVIVSIAALITAVAK